MDSLTSKKRVPRSPLGGDNPRVVNRHRRAFLLWALVGCPVVTLVAVGLAGVDGGLAKFVFLLCIWPFLATLALGVWLRLRPLLVIPMSFVSSGLGLGLWVGLLMLLYNQGVFE